MNERNHHITIDGLTFAAPHGALLLDAALRNGIALPHNCRAGHCGTCRVRLVAGDVEGGEGSEPDVVHACQCRIAGDVVVATKRTSGVRSVAGIVSALRPVSAEVVEVGIKVDRAMPYLPGQYAQLSFSGYPSRPFSITHALDSALMPGTMFFHMRRMMGGRVTQALGKRIKPGHRVTVTGPFGSAHFRPNQSNRLVLIGTSTGFAPIWSIAVAALRENAQRCVMVITGGRTLNALYMGPALARLARFPNVVVVPICSASQDLPRGVMRGRPTDYIPRLLPTDVIYACGAPEMVDAVKQIASRVGVVCHADPFTPTDGENLERSSVSRAIGRLGLTAIRDLASISLDRGRSSRTG